MSNATALQREPELDLSSWLTKAEAAQALQTAEKTVDRLAAKGSLHKEWRKRPGLPGMVVFHPGDVERERQARAEAAMPKAFLMPETPKVGQPTSDVSDTSIARVSNGVAPADLAHFLAAILKARQEPAEPVVPLNQKIFLTEPEAVAYTGVGAMQIRQKVDSEKIGPHGARVYRRAELEKL